jgi:hypothetical protein
MGGRDTDAIFVRKALVLRIVEKEDCSRVWIPRPHSGPHEVCLKPKQQLVDSLVKIRIVPAELLQNPSGKCWSLVIDKYATVLNAWLALGGVDGKGKDIGVEIWGNICPPIPSSSIFTISNFP